MQLFGYDTRAGQHIQVTEMRNRLTISDQYNRSAESAGTAAAILTCPSEYLSRRDCGDFRAPVADCSTPCWAIGSASRERGRTSSVPKSFPVQQDDHFYALCRYVERNALRAGLVERAEDWNWGSLWDRVHGLGATGLLSEWPVPVPQDWLERVNAAETEAELEAIRRSVKRGRPLGQEG